MNSTKVDPTIIKKAPIVSALYMGLGQLIYLKQYIRGALFAFLETLMLFFVIFDLQSFKPNFQGPIVKSLVGLITLGEAKPHLGVKFRDHSIFMMITGLIVLIICIIYICVHIFNVIDAKKSAERIIQKDEYPSMIETQKFMEEKAFPYFGILPVVILMSFFTIVPLLFSGLVAFTNYSSPDHIPPNNLVDWVGVENFTTMFSPTVGETTQSNTWFGAFTRVALWTLVWAFFSTITCYFAGMFFSVILQDNRIKISKFYRVIFILPYAIPPMLTLFVWQNLLNGTFGPINRTLIELKLIAEPIRWLTDPKMARLTLILVNMWIGFPYSMILTTSSMTAIPSQLYEAATIDGANKWYQFKSITLPLVLFQTMPLLIMQFAGNINNFGAVFFLTSGGPTLRDTIATQAGATDLLISWIYKLTYNTPNQYNLASVLSILIFIVMVPFAVFSFTRTKSFKKGEV